jgi:hypothetical protein
VQLDIEDSKTNAILSLKDNRLRLEVRQRMNDPVHFKAQRNALSGANAANAAVPPLKVSARVPFHFQRARVGDLRAAFPVAFATFGYRYICHPRLSLVREQLANPDQALVEGAWGIAGSNLPEDPYLFLQHAPFAALLVRMRSMLIALPWLDGPDPFFPYVRAHMFGQTVNATGDDLVWPSTMTMVLDVSELAS